MKFKFIVALMFGLIFYFVYLKFSHPISRLFFIKPAALATCMLAVAVHHDVDSLRLFFKSLKESNHEADVFLFNYTPDKYNVSVLQKWHPTSTIVTVSATEYQQDASFLDILKKFKQEKYSWLTLMESNMMVSRDWWATFTEIKRKNLNGVFSLSESENRNPNQKQCAASGYSVKSSIELMGSVWPNKVVTSLANEYDQHRVTTTNLSSWCRRNKVPMLAVCKPAMIKISEGKLGKSDERQTDIDFFEEKKAPNSVTEQPDSAASHRIDVAVKQSSGALLNKQITLTCPNFISIPGVVVKSDTVSKSWTFVSSRVGNVLSPYWAARAFAEVGGYKYTGTPFAKGTWMFNLPQSVGRMTSDEEQFLKLCQCNTFEYFHKCPFGWGPIVTSIRKDTRNALMSFKKMEMQFKKSDWLIYDRCCIFCHGLHGFANLEIYNSLPRSSTFTIYTLTQDNIDDTEGNGWCGKLHKVRDKYIQARSPNARIVKLKQGDRFQDFAKLVFAPNVIVPSAGSSWSLWSLLANDGNVVTVPMIKDMDLSVYPSNFKISAAKMAYKMSDTGNDLLKWYQDQKKQDR